MTYLCCGGDKKHLPGCDGGGGGKGGRHARPNQCTFTWQTSGPPGSHTSHQCVNANKGKGPDGNQCGSEHLCRNWHCSERSSG